MQPPGVAGVFQSGTREPPHESVSGNLDAHTGAPCVELGRLAGTALLWMPCPTLRLGRCLWSSEPSLTAQVSSGASGWLVIISHGAGARASGYLEHLKLHDQGGAGSGQPALLSRQAG